MTLRILAATDLSVPSLLAVTGAARLTAAAAARLDIVHVIRQWRWTPLAWLRNAIAIEVAAERRLAAAVADAVKEGAEARGHLVTGAPVATLEALSRELAADLVVLGTRGSRGAPRRRARHDRGAADRAPAVRRSGGPPAGARALPDAARVRRHQPRRDRGAASGHGARPRRPGCTSCMPTSRRSRRRCAGFGSTRRPPRTWPPNGRGSARPSRRRSPRRASTCAGCTSRCGPGRRPG